MSDVKALVAREAQLAREGRVEVRHAPFAEHQLRVPEDVWRGPLAKAFPGLLSKNHDEFEAAYARLLESPLADPWRVRTRKAQLGHL